MSIATGLRAARTAIANRRIERRAHRQLAKELAGFSSPAERAELENILSRYSSEETREIRAILSRQDLERVRRSSVLSGLGS